MKSIPTEVKLNEMYGAHMFATPAAVLEGGTNLMEHVLELPYAGLEAVLKHMRVCIASRYKWELSEQDAQRKRLRTTTRNKSGMTTYMLWFIGNRLGKSDENKNVQVTEWMPSSGAYEALYQTWLTRALKVIYGIVIVGGEINKAGR